MESAVPFTFTRCMFDSSDSRLTHFFSVSKYSKEPDYLMKFFDQGVMDFVVLESIYYYYFLEHTLPEFSPMNRLGKLTKISKQAKNRGELLVFLKLSSHFLKTSF